MFVDLPWVAILRYAIQFAAQAAEIVRDRQLLAAGEAQELARGLAKVAQSAGIAQQLEDEIADWSDQQIDDELARDDRPS